MSVLVALRIPYEAFPENLAPSGRKHHRLKTHHGRDPDLDQRLI